MSGYTNDPYDYGGVHLNSGIPNHAFYLAAYNVGGYAWEKVGRVWYAALCDTALVKINANFADFKAATITHAGKLFKGDKAVEEAVKNAWEAVGV
jgi:Zn-dependent metalloprotease